MKSEEQKIRAIQMALGEPVDVGFDQKTQKIRTTLIIVSVIGITYVLGGLSIQEGSSFLGLKFDGLDDSLFLTALLATTVYFAVHFVWSGLDSLLEWRVRVTGTRLAFVTTGRFSAEGADYPNDPRQSSLLRWWQEEAQKFCSISSELERISNKLEACHLLMKEFRETPNVHNVEQSLDGIRESIGRLANQVKQLQDTLESKRILVSLERFEKWFSLFLRSQNLRWLLIEFLLPLCLVGYATILLSNKIS